MNSWSKRHLGLELAGFDPFQASRVLRISGISVCQGRRASIHAAKRHLGPRISSIRLLSRHLEHWNFGYLRLSKNVEHQFMLYTAYLVPELAAFDPFQASRALQFRVSPFVKVVEHQLHAANAIWASNWQDSTLSRHLEYSKFRLSPLVKDIEHQLMLANGIMGFELAGVDPLQASRVLEFRSISVCEVYRASTHVPNGIWVSHYRIRPFPGM